MVPGFNHNVMHKGKLFHIQTEDKGRKGAEIVTHLFVGGNILNTKRTSYTDILEAENLTEIVREMMEEQHKNMLRDLKNGQYDEQIGGATETPKPTTPVKADEKGLSLDEVILNYLSADEGP